MGRNLITFCCVLVICWLSETTTGQERSIVNVIGKPMFNVAVLRSKKPAVVFYYSSSKCQPCNWNLLPMLDKMIENKGGAIKAFKVDLDRVDLQEEHGINTIPTTITYFQGDPYDVAEGASWGRIVGLVNRASKIKE